MIQAVFIGQSKRKWTIKQVNFAGKAPCDYVAIISINKCFGIWRGVDGVLMLVTSLCWWLNDGDHFKMMVTKKRMLVTFFCMLVTSQSVTNIIFCHNVMLVTDMLCWRHKIQPGAIFNTIFLYLWTNPEGITSVTNIIIRQNVMLVTDIWCWCLSLDVGDVTCHQHPKLVTNTFGLQHPSPTSM